ncbi:MAG: DUF2269 family protein [Gammaproteobacteria bacterium]
MNLYLWLKLVHVVSATVLFGTGMGTAFFMWKSYTSGNDQAFAQTTRSVVLADWIFTTPAVIIQLATGIWLTNILGISFASSWFLLVLGLYVLVGACWIPVVWIQIRIRNLLASGARRDEYRSLMRIWIGLGIPAFTSVLGIFYLMISKVGAYE